MSDASRFCKDCRFQRSRDNDPHPFFWECAHPSAATAPKVDLVTGVSSPPGAVSCSEARIIRELCGKAGRYWEPRGFG
jgi:hypothetical protein